MIYSGLVLLEINQFLNSVTLNQDDSLTDSSYFQRYKKSRKIRGDGELTHGCHRRKLKGMCEGFGGISCRDATKRL